jgi:hypothetical protein
MAEVTGGVVPDQLAPQESMVGSAVSGAGGQVSECLEFEAHQFDEAIVRERSFKHA